MQKINAFILGVLIALALVTPGHADLIQNDPVCGNVWGFGGIGYGAALGDYPNQLYDWDGTQAWYLSEKEHYDGNPTLYCDSDPLDFEGTDGNGLYRIHIYKIAEQGTCTTSNGPGASWTAYWYKLRPSETTCAYEQPSTCVDGIKNVDETGIDCGGSCSAPCVAFCPDGWTNVADLICASDEVPMINGSCPSDYPQANLTDQVCQATQPITWAESSYDPDAPPDLENFITFTEDQTVDSTTTYNTVDNGNGTSTRTEVETKTESKTGEYDKTTTTTTTVVYDNATGATISKTVDVDSQQQQVADPGDGVYAGDPDGVDGAERVAGSTDGSALNWSPLKAAADTLMTKFPFSVVNDIDGVLDSWIVVPQTPQIDVPMPSISETPFVMDLYLLDPLAEFFRACLGFIAYLGGAWVVIRTWRG